MRLAIYIATISLCLLLAALQLRPLQRNGSDDRRDAGGGLLARHEVFDLHVIAVENVDAVTTASAELRHGEKAEGVEERASVQGVPRSRPELDKCSLPIRTLVTRGAGPSLRERLEAIDVLPSELDPVDRYALYMFLLDSDRVDNLTPDQERVLVNDIMKLLRRQVDGSPEMWTVLSQIYRDRTQDIVIRDYAIQHLGSWYENYTSNKEVEAVLWEAAQNSEGTVSGAALLSLSRVSRINPALEKDRIGHVAIVMAKNDDVSIAARTTSLAIAAQFAGEEVLVLARKLAQEAQSVSLRLAAIGVLGDRGSVEDISLLKRLEDVGCEGCSQGILQAIIKLNKT